MNAVAQLEPVALSFDDEALYEIIDGQRVEMTPMSVTAFRLANFLASRLILHAIPADLGETLVEGLFRLPLPVERNRRPDVAFVSHARWPKGTPTDGTANAWEVVPDLAVEIVSPTDRVEELMRKIDEYFQAGVTLVWVVHVEQALVYVHESPTSVRILSRADTLDGGAVLPGFRLPLSQMFREA